jgi:hypothetical protein
MLSRNSTAKPWLAAATVASEEAINSENIRDLKVRQKRASRAKKQSCQS